MNNDNRKQSTDKIRVTATYIVNNGEVFKLTNGPIKIWTSESTTSVTDDMFITFVVQLRKDISNYTSTGIGSED